MTTARITMTDFDHLLHEQQFFGATQPLIEIGLILKPNHHCQLKIVQISTTFRLVFRLDQYEIGEINSSLLLKIKWKQHHLFSKWVWYFQVQRVSDTEKLHTQRVGRGY